MEEPAVLRLTAFLDTLNDQTANSLALWLPGRTLDALPTAVLERLAGLVRVGRIELLTGLFFLPEPDLTTSQDIAGHFAHNGVFWDRFDLAPTATAAWLTDTNLTDDLLEALPDTLEFAIVRSEIVDVATPAQFLLKTKNRNIHCISTAATAAQDQICLLTCDLFAENTSSGITGCPELSAATTLLATESCRALSMLRGSDIAGLPFVAQDGLRNVTLKESWLHTPRIRERMAELRESLQPLPELIATKHRSAENLRRLTTAWEHFLRAQERPGMPAASISHSVQYGIIRRCLKELLHVQVEIDSIRNSDIDPIEGWVSVEQKTLPAHGGMVTVLDNPFLRIYCAPEQAGSISALEYKPRKFDILNTRGAPSPYAAMGVLVPRTMQHGESTYAAIENTIVHGHGITRRNPGMAVFRLRQTLGSSSNSATEFRGELYKDITIKSGIGAFLPNATTGFSLEYWIEAPSAPADDLLLSLDFPLMLPSGNADGMSVRTLLPVGGIAEQATGIAERMTVTSERLPAGLYGARLIDGIEHWIIEFRSAKPLEQIEIIPFVPTERSCEAQDGVPSFGGVLLRLMISAAKAYEDSRSNVLFISIP